MKGEVLHYDDNAGAGQISGADGIRYNFTRADLKQLVPISKGSRVDFDFEGKNAKDIYLDGPATSSASGAVAYDGPIEPDLGLWGYFVRAYTKKFASFSGRARRKEYWSFVLFVAIIYIILTAIAIGGIGGAGPVNSAGDLGAAMGRSPLFLIGAGLGIIFSLLSILPGLGLLVRRLHDIGQSGWIALILIIVSAIPYVGFLGSIAILVVALIKGQPNENKFGPPVTPAS